MDGSDRVYVCVGFIRARNLKLGLIRVLTVERNPRLPEFLLVI